MRLVDLCPYGVFPPRSGGHRLVHHTSFCLGLRHEVWVFAMGLRRSDGLRLRSFVQRPGGRYVEYRHVTPLTLLSYLRRRRTGLPPLRASSVLRWTAPDVLKHRLAAADVVQVETPWQFAFARATASCPIVLVEQNAEAQLLAARTPGWTFLVVGSVGRPADSAGRVRVTGAVDDVLPFLRAADVALNPMTEGGGVNLKVPEYLAMGLPVVTTRFGMRGLDIAD